MSEKEYLGLLSIFLSLIGYGVYIRSIIRKVTKPHAFSWIIWSVLMGIVFFAQMSRGGGAGAWVTGASALMCCIISAGAIVRGEKNITRGDWLAFVGAALAIPVWYVTHDPLWAVVLSTCIDAMAYYPTFRKSWHKPFEENFVTYSMDTVKWTVALFALESYSPTTLIYPLFLMMANIALVSMILLRRGQTR
ncbi:MAG TPA: hypothetical protein VFR09_03025 [Alphaproteobacteria bacterium]|nr:hypothetical protein [Alphaproteobacteria bacterium]